MSIENPLILSPEVVTPALIRKFIEATNKVWNLTYYDDVVSYPEAQVVVTKSLPEEYLNSAQLVTVNDLKMIEKRLSELGIDRPAIYIDPLTPSVILKQMEETGYELQTKETEIWRLFNLETSRISTDNLLKIPKESINLEIWKIDEIPQEVLKVFLEIDKRTNELDDDTFIQLSRNLTTKIDRDVEIYILVSKVNNKYVGCLCLGIADNIGILSEAGVLDEYRGKSIFPWMRLKAAEFTKSKGGKWMASSVLSWNKSSLRGSDKSGFIQGFERQLYIKK